MTAESATFAFMTAGPRDDANQLVQSSEGAPGQLGTQTSADRFRRTSKVTVRGRGMTILAGAFALGITVGWHQSHPVVLPWIVGGAACLVISLVTLMARAHGLSFLSLTLGIASWGAGWVTLRTEYVPSNDLAAMIGDESTLVRVEGVATRAPELRMRTTGSMARFDYRPPATYFPMRVHHVLSSDGDRLAVHGSVLVRVDQTVPPFRAGDEVRVTGFLLRPAMPRNPGEFDFRQYAKSLRQAGILTVGHRELVEITPARRNVISSWLLNVRDAMRLRASAWLLANMPAHDQSQRDAVLVSLLLGERDAEIDQVYRSFQRVGLAHILAISGFHLAVLAAFVMFVAQQFGGSRRWHGVLVITLVIAYLLVVEPRMPVLRAGVMCIAGSLGSVFSRRLHVGGLVALSAVLLLIWRPDQLFNAGFQLTFGVVLALIHLAPVVRARWFGPPNLEVGTSAEMIGQWGKTTLAVTVVAWLAAVPIAAYHFGSIALAGIPMSVIAVPLAAVILALGFAKILLGGILPSAAMLLGLPLSFLTESMLALVRAVEPLPWASIDVPPPSWAWAVLALAWVCWWGLGNSMQRRSEVRLKWVVAAALIVWLIAPTLPRIPWIDPRPEEPTLRIDMLAVGDGSCFLVRSGGATMVFDAGSSTDLGAGERSIVPAMRRLGVRRIDVLCISHANLDHYSAVVEIADAFDVRSVRVTPQFTRAAESDELSPLAYLLSNLVARRVMVVPTSAGDEWMLGGASVRCIHPSADEHFERVNDSSMVLQVDAGSRRALLTGDIQAAGMARLMRPDIDLSADVLELPHHGSFHDAATEFVKRVDPSVVMQSTGWSRWQRDRWRDLLAGSERLVSVRDGASSVLIWRDGRMQVERFLAPGTDAGGSELE